MEWKSKPTRQRVEHVELRVGFNPFEWTFDTKFGSIEHHRPLPVEEQSSILCTAQY